MSILKHIGRLKPDPLSVRIKTGISQPINIPISERGYRLVAPYCYDWEHQKNTYRLEVPAGFIYDGASVPRIVWTLSGLRPDGLIRAAATVHDFMYHHKGQLPSGSVRKLENPYSQIQVSLPWSRKNADKLFARMMREAGVSKYRRRLAYLAVRVFGRIWWKK